MGASLGTAVDIIETVLQSHPQIDSPTTWGFLKHRQMSSNKFPCRFILPSAAPGSEDLVTSSHGLQPQRDYIGTLLLTNVGHFEVSVPGSCAYSMSLNKPSRLDLGPQTFKVNRFERIKNTGVKGKNMDKHFLKDPPSLNVLTKALCSKTIKLEEICKYLPSPVCWWDWGAVWGRRSSWQWG